jgi:hypothetical protein
MQNSSYGAEASFEKKLSENKSTEICVPKYQQALR